MASVPRLRPDSGDIPTSQGDHDREIERMSFARDERLQETAGVFPDIDLEYQDQWAMVVADSAQDFS